MKRVTFKFKAITADSLVRIADGVELDEDGFPMVDILEHVEEGDNEHDDE